MRSASANETSETTSTNETSETSEEEPATTLTPDGIEKFLFSKFRFHKETTLPITYLLHVKPEVEKQFPNMGPISKPMEELIKIELRRLNGDCELGKAVEAVKTTASTIKNGTIQRIELTYFRNIEKIPPNARNGL